MGFISFVENKIMLPCTVCIVILQVETNKFNNKEVINYYLKLTKTINQDELELKLV